MTSARSEQAGLQDRRSDLFGGQVCPKFRALGGLRDQKQDWWQESNISRKWVRGVGPMHIHDCE